MASEIQVKLEKLGIHLDNPAMPAGNYVPVLVVNDMVYVSGQLPLADGVINLTGQVGNSVTVEEAQEQARQRLGASPAQCMLQDQGLQPPHPKFAH